MRLTQRTKSVLLATLALVSSAGPAAAQWGFWRGDSLLAEGHLAAAESAYYAATRDRPRDPRARAALGKYLAARGAPRVGAVLLEEAQFFGGDSAGLARSLARIYARAGDYAALDSLRPNVLSPSERRRVKWLATHPPEATLRDSVVILAYQAAGDGRGIGTVRLRMGKTEWPAVIDPRVSGLILPASSRGDVRIFGPEGQTVLAVAEAVRIGSVVFSNVPATLGSPDERVRIGFDVFAPYHPTFDPAHGFLTVRRVGRRTQSPQGSRVPALFDETGLRLLIGRSWHPSTENMPSMLLATRKWMWDGKAGDVVLLP